MLMASGFKQWLNRTKSTGESTSRHRVVPVASVDAEHKIATDNIPPMLNLQQWKENVKASFTGPNSGMSHLDLHSEEFPECFPQVPQVTDWRTSTEHAYGISLSLYEEDKEKGVVVGEPNADVFAILERENNTILAVADGASWGKKPRLAARCAVNIAITHLTRNTERFNQKPSSQTLSTLLMEAIDQAHECIIRNQATLTTLSIAVVCQLKPSRRLAPSLPTYGLFTACVGDSPIFVYSPRSKTVTEATENSHPKDGIRIPNLSGGALGPAIGTLPDMENLSFNYNPVQKDDIVFITSDGVSDNFFPQTIRPGCKRDGLFASAPDLSGFVLIHGSGCVPSSSHAPPVKKCCQHIAEIESVLRRHETILSSRMTAQTVAAALINFIVELTDEKRRFYSKCKEDGIMIKRKCKEDPEFAKTVNSLPGKLDHATVVAYSIGIHDR